MPRRVCETGGMRLPIRGLFLLLLAALLGLLVGVVPASAHSRLLSISPADGASVPASPAEVVLTFNEEVNPEFVTVRVTDGEGTVVAGEGAAAEGAVVTLPVTEPVPAGSYKVTYRVVSADSHPISGATAFTVEGDAQASPTSPAASPSASSSAPSESGPAPSASPGETNAAGDPTEASGDGTPAIVWIAVLVALAAGAGLVAYARNRDRSAS